jgi:pyruvate-ferredoxin/flavodoxin oxidoreductase
VREDLLQKLLAVAGADFGTPIAAAGNGSGNGQAHGANGGNGKNGTPAGDGAGGWEYEPVWIETPECTSCDECITINPKIFVYDEHGKAIVADPRGGPFKDIVRAAEKCTAGCIHPGTPFNPKEPDLQKLMKRAEKYH